MVVGVDEQEILLLEPADLLLQVRPATAPSGQWPVAVLPAFKDDWWSLKLSAIDALTLVKALGQATMAHPHPAYAPQSLPSEPNVLAVTVATPGGQRFQLLCEGHVFTHNETDSVGVLWTGVRSAR